MPVVCDFKMIIGDQPFQIGDYTTPSESWGGSIFAASFWTGGRFKDDVAFLIFHVRGLTYTESNVNVEVNNQVVGQITPTTYPGFTALETWWFTQLIAMPGSVLHADEKNVIAIRPVIYPGYVLDQDAFDDFQIKDMFCFFHQST